MRARLPTFSSCAFALLVLAGCGSSNDPGTATPGPGTTTLPDGAPGTTGTPGSDGGAGSDGATSDDGGSGDDEPDPGPPGPPPDFGPNVFIFDPSMDNGDIQNKLNDIYSKQSGDEFGTNRYAYFFKPGKYDLDVQIGYTMQVLGLGTSPDDVSITGAVRSKAEWNGGNATINFWRAMENLAVKPTQDGNKDVWAISQGTSFRRIHVQGALALSDNGWSSGGFVADSQIDDHIESGSQQQFMTRNTAITKWQGGSWNMVFVGDEGTPSGDWPGTSYTVVDAAPVIREKPYLTIDGDGHYWIMVPALQEDASGTTWKSGPTSGRKISTELFYTAHADKDDAASLNAALAAGKNLLFTPGIYELDSALEVTRAHTVVLGLGLTTLVPTKGNAVMTVADVDDVSIAGILFEAGLQESDVLLRVGEPGSSKDHSKKPTGIFDVFCRVGGRIDGKTKNCLTIESNNVILDNLWMWRADHGEGADWNVNRSKNGLIVNGNDVTAYGLFVEHFQEFQTMWNGNGGRVYFYQSEMPYDPPSRAEWSHDGVDGYASFKVADAVTSHEAWGLGVYCVFYNNVSSVNALETPQSAKMHHMVTEWLGVNGGSSIQHIINGTGDTVNTGSRQAKTSY